MSRRDQLAAGLAATRERVQKACGDAGRDPDDVSIIVVTKTFPADDVRMLAELGVGDVGENRDQEAAPKAAECADVPVRWHFVGQLQTNKAASVARYASAVHSVDRPRLVTALDRAATAAGRTLDCLVQVSLDEIVGRGGAAFDQVGRLADQITESESLRLRGVMAVAPLNADPGAAFARLRQVSDALRAVHPAATWVSAGMSGDLEAAIAHGATHLRLGSAILGDRQLRR
jgi:PLP dependent protein